MTDRRGIFDSVIDDRGSTKIYAYAWIGLFFLLASCQWQTDSRSHREAAMYNVQLGLAYLAQGNRPLAKRKLLRALEQAPNVGRVNLAMGYFLEKSGDIQAAERYYHRALVISPHCGEILHHYGSFLCRSKKYAEADRYFNEAAQDLQYEYTASVYESAGMCALKSLNRSLAKMYFVKALAHDPHLERSVRALKVIQRG